MINFQNTLVKVNNTGIKAQSVSLSSNSSLSPIYALGYKEPLSHAVSGPQTTEISINYTPQADADPNWSLLNNKKTIYEVYNTSPVPIILGGISGSFYLKSYSISFSPNSTVKAVANYQSFGQISGLLSPDSSSPENNEYTGFFNGLSFNVNTYDPSILGPALPAQSIDLYALSYSADFNINPIYGLGSKYPIQVNLLGGSEKLSFTKEDYVNPGFSGLSVKETIGLIDNNIICYNIGKLYGQGNSQIAINISGMKATKNSTDFSVGNYSFTNYDVEKFF